MRIIHVMELQAQHRLSCVQALRLEPHLVLSNLTGIPLQLMQLRGGGYAETGYGVMPRPATLAGLPRAGPGGQAAGGLAAHGISAPAADAASTLDLPTGVSAHLCCQDTCTPSLRTL